MLLQATTAAIYVRTATLYLRVSTDAQERDGTSLDTQQRACEEFARAAGWSVTEVIRDTASGFTLDRPGMERLRQVIRRGDGTVVLAYAVDRLSRNQNHIGVLFDEAEQAGARLEFVSERFEDTAMGRFILAARAFMAEVEREKIAERTMRGKAERARAGKLPQATGRGIYGYRYDRDSGRRVVVEEQAAVVRSIFDGFVAGEPIVGIANRLNENGVTALSGGIWHAATIYHMLQNETYTGRTVYRRTVARRVRDPHTGQKHRRVELRDESEHIEVDGATPAIIAGEVFAAAHERLRDPERLRQGRRVYDYPLSGHMVCLRCGRAMVGQTLKGRFRYYRCRAAFAGPRADRCKTTYVRAGDLEDAVRAEILKALDDDDLLQREYDHWASTTQDIDRSAELEQRIASLDGQKTRLVKLYQLGEVNDEYFATESRALRDKRAALEIERGRLTGPAQQPPSRFDLEQARASLHAWIEHAGPERLAELAKALQLRVLAETSQGELRGVIPGYAPPCSDADVRAMVGETLRQSFSLQL